MMYFPGFNSEFLDAIIFSLKKKNKSLKHRINKVICDKVYDVVEEHKIEKLELTLHELKSSKGIVLRFYAWGDRWVWIDARRRGKIGWDWEWTFEGRMSGNCTPRDLVAAIDESYTVSLLSNRKSLVDEIYKIWKPLLAGELTSVK
ncbi:hypothetical protein MNBD_GAMMA08-1240 [hydrothermal vent metagenome]|uniref:Uncharacterized protein n=1 Tax=hydrothermal vent metagenome TaxID=652676 RepID=A0A3B0XDQ3_9ZZZZ